MMDKSGPFNAQQIDGSDNIAEELELFQAACDRIAGLTLRTPLLHSLHFSKELACNVYLKMESEQITNSFKLRGATNKIRLLQDKQKDELEDNGIITASSGNHALACAHACLQLGLPVTCYTSTAIADVKVDNLKAYSNMSLVKHCPEPIEAENYARYLEQTEGRILVAPYNDMDVVRGQGTIGCEILQQLVDVDMILVPVGGGGLIGGIAMYAKLVKPSIRIIGCQPKNDAAMWESLQAGHVTDIHGKQTISDGTAGDIEAGAVTFTLCQQYVDQWVLLSEEEIEQAVFDMLKYHKKVIEGAAGLTIAALRKISSEEMQGKNVVLVICGGNISLDKVQYLIQKYDK